MPNSELQSAHQILGKLKPRSLVLTGMMGCGKTAIGRLAAKYLGLPFYDADQEIEKAAGMSVADFFKTYGEDEFRAGECKVIARLLKQGPCVLALGGGAFVAQETRECIADDGISLWLQADLEVLYARVMRRPGKRPMLQNGDPKTILADLLEKRKASYATADIQVETSTTSKESTLNRVILALGEYLDDEENNK